jgi:hypothetical protein
MIKAVCASETLVHFNETTGRYNPESCNIHTRRRENLISYGKYRDTLDSVIDRLHSLIYIVIHFARTDSLGPLSCPFPVTINILDAKPETRAADTVRLLRRASDVFPRAGWPLATTGQYTEDLTRPNG